MSIISRVALLRTAAFALTAVLFVPATFGQATQPGQPGGSVEDWRKGIQQFRDMAAERLKQQMGATDEEFAVLRPKIEKIQQLQFGSETRMIGMTMVMPNMFPGATTAPAAAQPGQRPQRQPDFMSLLGDFSTNLAYIKGRELQDAIESKESTPETFRTRLAELRAARKQVKQEIERNQQELKSICSVHQEAVLVLLGILE